MRTFTAIVTFLSLAAAVAGDVATGAVKLDNGHGTVSAEVLPEEDVGLSARDEYNCKGSGLCGGPLITSGMCDNAYRKINAFNTYVGGGADTSGTCDGRCGIFVNGAANCRYNGGDLINAFNELRSRGCKKCGIKTFPNGCEIKIDYVTGC